MKIIDARGRGCPEPVLMTKKALKDHDSFEVIVNEHVAKENIFRLLNKTGKNFHVTKENNEFKITIEK